MHTRTQSWVSMIHITTRLIAIVVCVLMVIGSFASSALAAAGVPRIMNYQGRLMNAGGTLLGGSGTDYCVKFSLYDDATIGGGDVKLWPTSAPSTMTVSVRSGIFNAGVGDTNAGGDTLDFNFEDTDAAYLNVEVATKVGATCAAGDGAESFENLSPRQRVTATGYAINSATLGGQSGAYYLANSFSTTSATVFTNDFVHASSTIPKTYTSNTFVGSNTFADIVVTSATTTNLNIGSTISGAGLTSCSGSNDKLVWNTATRQFACGTDLSGGGGGADGNWTFFNNTGIRLATTSNQVLVGGTATTSLAKFESQGGALFDNATSTTLNTTVFGLGGLNYFTSLTGSGLVNTTGILTLDRTGDWTGTFDGQDGSYYLANSFSTSSASHFASVGLAFSTTSSAYFLSQNQGNAFSTTSADYYTGASSTIPKTYSNNTFSGTNDFQNVTATGVTSTASFATTASSSNLFSSIANIGSLIATAITGNTITATNATTTTLFSTFSSSTETRANTASFGSATIGSLNTSATSTGSNGFNITDGCFAVDGVCLSTGGSSASSTLLSDSNSWTGINVFTGNTTFGNATSTTFFSTFSSSTESRANTSSFGSMIAGSSTVNATSTTDGLFASFSRMIAAVIDSLTASVLTAFNATVGNLTATSSATLASTTAYGRFITGNIIATSTATSTFAGALGVGITNSGYEVSVLGTATGPTAATGTAVMAISNNDNTLSSGNNVLRLNIRTPYGTACTSGTTCPRFTEYFAGVGAGSDTGGRGVGSLRLSTAGTGITQTSGAADFAEYMQLSESAAVGDIVSLNSSGQYRKATAGEALIGVVSDNAAFVGNANLEGQVNAHIVGFAGVIRTTVSTANGAINAGDLIAASNVPGVGIKLSKSGYALGQALESYSAAGNGTIAVLVLPKFVDAAIALDSYGGGASGASGYWDLSTSTNTVSLASSTNSLAIQGSASTSNLVVSNGFTFGKATGVLRSVAGVVTSTLVNLASDVTGVLGITNGGTGTSTAPTYGKVLVGNAEGGYDLLATSSLGISSGAAVWGTISGTLSAQTDLQNALNAKFGLSSWYATTTDALAEGATNKYYTDNRVQTFLNTISKGYFFSTTSASNFASAGLAFSTSSADYYASQNPSSGFSTTSTDYWKTQNNFYSTTSTAYDLSTYDKGFFFSTTSVAYWDSTQFRWATTSTDAWFATKSTDNLAEGVTNKYYSNGLVNTFIGASTTIPKTFTNNSFTGTNTFGNISASGATTTSLSTGSASTTNLTISALQNSLLYTGPGGMVSSVTVNGPILFSAGTLSIQQGSATQDGFLSSGDYNSFNSRLSTTTLGTIDKGYFFSTTSAAVFSAAGLSFSTTSTDFWKAQNNFFSTTSASHFSSLGLAFSTTSASTFLSLNQGAAFSTTSASNFASAGLAFSTTSAAYYTSQNQGASFSTTSANAYMQASTTVPATYKNNTFTGTNGFQNITATGATTTVISTGIASTTNLTISSLQNSMLYTGPGGVVSAVSINGPLTFSTGSLSIQQASSTASGYLSSSDWSSFNSRLSTSSLSLFDKGYFFSTTSAQFYTSAGLGFSTTSADAHITASSSIPKTYSANTFIGINNFANITATGATTTSFFTGTASSTNIFANIARFGSLGSFSLTGSVAAAANSITGINVASTTDLWISNIRNGLLATNEAGNVVATSTPTASSFNATSNTASQLPYASTTALSVLQQLSIGAANGTMLQGGSTGTSTFAGFLSVTGTNSTSTFSGGLQASRFNLTGGTSTAATGINLTGGCFSVNGLCLAAGAVNSVTASDTTLTVSPNSGSVQVSLNLSNANVWLGLQTMSGGLIASASSTIGNGTQSGGLTISGGATTTGSLAVTGAGTSTFSNDVQVSRLNATATSTFFGMRVNGGGLQLGNIVSCTRALETDASGNVVCGTDTGTDGVTITTFTTTGANVWTKSNYTNLTFTEVIVTAGGGGGGGASGDGNNEAAGGGGGSGGTSISMIPGASLGTTVDAIVGADGAGGGAGLPGSLGGNSSFGTFASSTGGGLGTGDNGNAVCTTIGVSGSGGATTTAVGDIKIAGARGFGVQCITEAATGGTGGASYWGGGGSGYGSNLAEAGAGQPGGAFGAGGGGGSNVDTNGATALGGSGGTGVVVTMNYTSSGGDLAEWYETKSDVEAADVVAISSDMFEYDSKLGLQKSSVLKKAQVGDAVVGVVSSVPNQSIGADVLSASKHPRPVALAGRVPVKISLENGPIKAGDLVTVSTVPGAAMRATKAGATLGRALEDSDCVEGSGCSVLIMVHTSYTNGALLKVAFRDEGINLDEIQPGVDVARIILAEMMQQKKEITATTSLSEINTDRLVAGLEIITPRVVADTIALNVIEPVQQDIRMRMVDGGKFIIEKVGSSDLSMSFGAASSTDGTLAMSVDDLGNAIFTGALTAATLQIGSAEQPGGITMFDRVTKQPYCLHIQNGVMATASGSCDESTTSSASTPGTGEVAGQATTTEAVAPTDAPAISEEPVSDVAAPETSVVSSDTSSTSEDTTAAQPETVIETTTETTTETTAETTAETTTETAPEATPITEITPIDTSGEQAAATQTETSI